jgi:RNA polymerase sigma factor (sigma-70 family)
VGTDVTGPAVDAATVIGAWDRLGLRVAYLITGDRESAMDAFQEASRRLWQYWERSGPPDNPDALFRTILVRESRRIAAAVARYAADPLGDDRPAAAGPDSATTIDLERAIGRLRPAQRAAVVLRHHLGLSDDEIGAALRCAPATVRSHLHRAYRALRLHLAQDPE